MLWLIVVMHIFISCTDFAAMGCLLVQLVV
jgi:hypothetical protein